MISIGNVRILMLYWQVPKYNLTKSVVNYTYCVNCIAISRTRKTLPATLRQMKTKLFFLLSVLLLPAFAAMAQKPFMEGTINYKVVFETKDHRTFNGTYVFAIKDGQIRKDLKLSNGFEDIVIINTDNNSIYSLRTKNGKKFVIQLSMDEMTQRQEPYKGFTLLEDPNKEKVIAGKKAIKGMLAYKNGTKTEIYFTPDWYSEKTITYERFPDAKFIPLEYTYKDDAKGFTMHMIAESVNAAPVENAIFRIPQDCKVISNEEYKQLSKE